MQPSNQHQQQQPEPQGFEEPPRLTPDDEAALDRAWAKVMAERAQAGRQGPRAGHPEGGPGRKGDRAD